MEVFALISPLQFAGILISVFFIYYSYLLFRKGVFQKPDFAAWIAIFIGLSLVSLFPQVLDPVVRPLSFIRLMDFILISAVFIQFGLVFWLYKELKISQAKIRLLVKQETKVLKPK